jgi:phage anti-repressor protein
MNNNITESQIFSLYESDQEFPIDFDQAWPWIGYSRKNNAKQALQACNFVEGIDTLTYQQLGTLAAPRPEERIMLTVDCFKMWAMMARTKEGRAVRLYFLECERKIRQRQAPAKAKSLLDLSFGELEMLSAYIVFSRIRQLTEVPSEIDPDFFNVPTTAITYAIWTKQLNDIKLGIKALKLHGRHLTKDARANLAKLKESEKGLEYTMNHIDFDFFERDFKKAEEKLQKLTLPSIDTFKLPVGQEKS